MTPSLFENDLHLLSGECGVINDFEGGVAAEHLKMELTPLPRDSSEHKLAVLHTQILEHLLKERVIQSTPT